MSTRDSDGVCPPWAVSIHSAALDPDTDWTRILDGQEAVIHLAARVHVMQETDPDPDVAYYRVNVSGTLRLAEAAAAAGVKRFVFLSTVKVNGEATGERPFTENDAPAPQDSYGHSKWEAEQGLRQLSDRTGLEVVILRPPLVYGPEVKGNFFSLLRLCASGVPLPFGLVRNFRSLIYVENFVDAICQVLERPEAVGRTFMVRDGQDLSTPELCLQLCTGLERSCRLLPVPVSLLRGLVAMTGRGAMVDRLVGDLKVDDSCIRRELGWIPPVDASTGLRNTGSWYRDRER